MKTSNKILISFIIFLFGGITALFIGSKYYGNVYDAANFVDKKTMLSPFSVVVAEEGSAFYLNSGNENSITNSHSKDSLPNSDFFKVRNDTLFISSFNFPLKLERGQVELTHISCVKIKSIVIKKYSEVRMEKFQADTLAIVMNNSYLDWRFENIAHLSIQAQDSEIYLEGEKLKKLAIKLNKTRLNTSIKQRTDVLSGSLINASDLRFSMSNTVSLNADQTSNYDFYNLGN